MRYIERKKQGIPKKPEKATSKPLSSAIDENKNVLQDLLNNCSDAVLREFKIGTTSFTRGLVVYFDGLVLRQQLDEYVMKPILLELEMIQNPASVLEQPELLQTLEERIIAVSELKKITSFEEVIRHISSGDSVLLIDGDNRGLAIATRGWAARSISAPENEQVVYGPKEGFVETLRFNTALMRRRIKSEHFKIESMVLGRITKTDVAFCYIDNIAPPQLVNEIRKRLQEIDIDAVLDTNYILELIMDHKSTIFTQAEYTEKSDRAVAHMLEGRICIMVDGSPMALVLPVNFPRYWISSEDYYTHYIPASLFRLGRVASFIIALTLPALYVAVISYHHEMVPTSLFLTIAASRQGVPFPSYIEAFFMELTFEMLREAGLRLPRAVGPAVSIVGALIIGDAAVRAGLVSTPMVVIVAFTGIASFVSPSYNASIIIRMARFVFLAAAALLGFLGIIIVLVIMLIHMVSLSSFGTPYLAPLAPLNTSEVTDVLLRRPWFKMKQRPYMEGMENQVRQKSPDKESN
jgi:hypothetical protein